LRQVLLLVWFSVGLAVAASAEESHPCSADAASNADRLLEFYAKQNGFDGKWSVDKPVTKMGTVRSIDGSQRFDVLELWGNLYRARYRMRFIYGMVDGHCALVGEEIFENTGL
jgi:hypothetical protein